MQYEINIANDFFEWRRAAGLSLRQAARVIGCDFGDLSKVENGKKRATGKMLRKMINKTDQQSSQQVSQHGEPCGK